MTGLRAPARVPATVLILALAVLAAIVAALVNGPPPPAAQASSHSEAPLIGQDPRADNTDLYAFVSPDRPDSVTIASVPCAQNSYRSTARRIVLPVTVFGELVSSYVIKTAGPEVRETIDTLPALYCDAAWAIFGTSVVVALATVGAPAAGAVSTRMVLSLSVKLTPPAVLACAHPSGTLIVTRLEASV